MRTRTRTLLAFAALLGLLGMLAMSSVASADVEIERIRIPLLGANEVPTNVHGNEDRGSVTVFFQDEDEGDESEPSPAPSASAGPTTEICFKFGRLRLSEGETLPVAGHIHLKTPGQPTGGVILHIFGTGDGVAPPTSYPTAKICRQAPVELIEQITRHPERYYINLHNSTHPAGVVRGEFPDDL